MGKLRNATLLFLVKRTKEEITDICLAMKKRGFGENRWNGVGGKVNEKDGETIEEAVKREAKEEIGIEVKKLNKVAELSFYFPHNPLWNQAVHTYFCDEWEGGLVESEEMEPAWFSIKELPFGKMWPDDIFWLPEVLKGNFLKAMFRFGENDIILEKNVKIVKNL